MNVSGTHHLACLFYATYVKSHAAKGMEGVISSRVGAEDDFCSKLRPLPKGVPQLYRLELGKLQKQD